MSSRPAWSTEIVPEQPRLHRETLFLTCLPLKKKERKKEAELAIFTSTDQPLALSPKSMPYEEAKGACAGP